MINYFDPSSDLDLGTPQRISEVQVSLVIDGRSISVPGGTSVMRVAFNGDAAALRAAIPALPQAEAPPADDNSYFGTLMNSLSGIITIRPIGDTDWRQVAEKAAAFADSGDITQAIHVIDGAEGEKPMALTQWRDRAAARLQLEAAVSQVSEAVLRQIAASGGAAQ